MRLDTGVCVSCLLREGLETSGDVSKGVYQTVLDELDTREKPWQLGNYEILEQIGCGGMGVIYRARQRHSRRIVAIKRVLSYRADSPGALQRFRREAQAVASLDHPNILPIYEVSESADGLPFFSMKYAERGSLHENVAALRDQPRKCMQLMAKVARAVEYAHSRGVLHRDIKPGNILLNQQGEPLVSDFGLAKLLDGSHDLTRSLTTFGTAGFIAPEQAGGATDDFTPAGDVYGLGAVLFNVLAGRPPFLGSNPVSVIRQASETEAPKLRLLAPSLDKDLETICACCLERHPAARYQSAGDLATDLERWLDGRPIVARPISPPARIWRWSQRNPKLVGAGVAGLLLGAAAVWLFRAELFQALPFNPPARSIAVLPFTDSSETTEHKHLGDGISEGILDTLGAVDGLRVVGRTSSFAFKGTNTNAGEVGQKLNVGNVLEGNLRRQGNRVRVTAELIDARNGFRVWTETYDREWDGTFAFQDEIARSIVDALKVKFGMQIASRKPLSNGAYNLYLRRLITNITHPMGPGSTDVSVPMQYPSNAIEPAHASPEGLASHRQGTRVNAAPSEKRSASTSGDEIIAVSTPAPPRTEVTISAPHRALEDGSQTNKIAADGPTSIRGIVKDANGEPIKGASVRIESRDGKQVFSRTKTDVKGRYVSQGLQPGVYRATLLVNGMAKASIMNTQTNPNQPTELNFDFKATSQANEVAKRGKHRVWMPGRTGTHLGGGWVEVDDEGNAQFGSNVQTYTTRKH